MSRSTTPADFVVDPACPNTPTRHGFHSAHREGCICPGPAYDKYRQTRDRDNARRIATRESRSKMRLNPDCIARRHFESRAAVYGCICHGNLEASAVALPVRSVGPEAVASIDECPSRGRHGTQDACIVDGCRCPGPGYDKWQAYRKRQADLQRIRDQRTARERRARAAETEHDARFPAVPEIAELDEETRMVLTSDEAACAGMDVNYWYPTGSGPESKADERYAKSVCARCPIRQACADGAIARGEPWGVWGGLSFSERRDAKRRREQRQVAA